MAIGTTGTWQVDNGANGDDTNNAGFFNQAGSSPGTDFSITAPISCTDLVLVTATTITSATIGFNATHVRNGIRITTNTGGFTAGLYEIISVTAGTATLDRAAGTSGTGGVARVGGALASPGGAGALFTAGSAQTIYVKNTGSNYTISATSNVAGGKLSAQGASGAAAYVVGYQTNRNRYNTDTGPTLVPGANSITWMVSAALYTYVHNIICDNSLAAKTGCTGIVADDGSTVSRCQSLSFATSFSTVGNSGAGTTTTWLGCYASAPISVGFQCNSGSKHKYIGCVASGGSSGAVHFNTSANDTTYIDCISKSAGASNQCFASVNNLGGLYQGCVAWTPGASSTGFSITSGCQGVWCINCITVACATGFSAGSGACGLLNCADYNSSTPNTGFNLNNGFITLAADPFTSASGGNFSLNNTAGAGAALRAVAFPTSFLGISTSSFLDIGAAQHADSVVGVLLMPSITLVGSVVQRKFTTRAFATGIPTTLAGSPVISIYKDNLIAQSVAGVTLTVDFDGVTGLNHVAIDTSSDGAFYTSGAHFEIVLTTGTVGGTLVVGEVLGDFDLAASATVPTAAQNATAVWQDATAGDFTVASSIGKALYVANIVPGAAGGHFIAGVNAATTVNITGTITTATNLTNLPAITPNWLTAAGIAASALNGKGDWLLASSYTAPANASIGSILTTVNAGLDVAVSTRAPAATALSTANWTNGRAANLDNLDVPVSTRSTYAGGAVTLNLAQVLGAARALDAIADTSLTLNDALHCAVAAATGKESTAGLVYTIKTPSTGTTLRTFTLDSATAPTSRT